VNICYEWIDATELRAQGTSPEGFTRQEFLGRRFVGVVL
jgi:hypothetical protein